MTPNDDGWNDAHRDYIERLFEEMGPSHPETTVALVDALRNYLRCQDESAEDLLREESITLAQFNGWRHGEERKQLTNILSQLEADEIDPTLQGLINRNWP